MASNTTFFTPVDPISINTLLTLTGSLQWILQTVSPDKQTERASGLGSNGDEAAWKAHNAKTTVTATYKCFAASGSLKLPSVGTVASTYHIDNIKLDYDPAGWPTLTVAMHKHSDASTHETESCNTYTTHLLFPAQYGIPVAITDDTPDHPTEPVTAPVPMFTLSAVGVGMRSLSFALSCSHVDETGGTGDWLAGDNHDGVETLDAEFTGVPDGEDLVVNATFHNSSDGKPEGNTAVNTRKVSYTRHILRD